jgi:hypothetical protein
MTTIDLALMRERDPVAFCDWGKALCCQSNKVDLIVTLVSPCMFNLVIGKKVVLGYILVT